MCTLSVISLAADADPHLAGLAGFRIAMNRDEEHARPAAIPPRWRAVGDSRAIWPIDPKGGGTWIGAREDGLVLCLLNYNLRPAPPAPRQAISRGRIIPSLIEHTHAEDAITALSTMELDRFAPFRLVVVGPDVPSRSWRGGAHVHELRWDGAELRRLPPVNPAACFVSSGLGDHTVAPRLELFRARVASSASPRAQDDFHSHAWPERPAESVMMHRPDARTVSVTTVEVSARAGVPHVLMAYRAIEGRPAHSDTHACEPGVVATRARCKA
ncbi:MAG: hypothetical protein DYG92_07145 [Leptolyngbya sp. PLA1]|nr:hypothetical protein [Leptolyngbya sp. PLA1]